MFDSMFFVGEILVVIFLLLLVTYWGNQLFQYRADLEEESEVLEKLKDVSGLEKKYVASFRGKEGRPLRDEAFREFCDDKKVSVSSDVAKHLRAIYEAGCTDAPIRVAELNNYTSKALFHRGTMLRSLLGIFIVVGLLGTLLGLGNGLSQLTELFSEEHSPTRVGYRVQIFSTSSRGAAEKSVKQARAALGWEDIYIAFEPPYFKVHVGDFATKDEADKFVQTVRKQGYDTSFPVRTEIRAGDHRSKRFKSFLKATKWAFIPSGLGIFFTLVGVCFYASFLKSICHPLASDLERVSREIWVPRFERTPSESALENLADAQKQLEENAEVMGRVAKFAKSVDQGLSDFAPNIETANNTVESFNESIKLVEKSSKIFGQTISQISEFEKSLKTMHTTTEQNTADIREMFKELRAQNSLIDKHLRNLQTFEESYTEGQRKTQEANTKLFAAATGAFDALKRRNEEIITAVGKPINTQLGQIESSLRNMRDPLDQSTEKIEGIAEQFAKHSKTLMEDLNAHYYAQVQNFKNDQDEQSKVLKSLDESTSALLDYLATSQSPQKQDGVHTGGMSDRLLFLFLGASLIAAISSVYIVWVR